ncbi:helix-turn-helix domain-containing protein [Maritimibacter sp. DP07]|uniref:Helix-turn-helix domain-containing protein n=1 Tax=Maritimibacter harenae TaxID=2606218 RepID=A0A845M329_9RHOB|nr:helix-turn-helix domain-containing protein [Maritimibacter harenae]MZR13419.1 helix-turn-helix domain-containing protein [Maritimibacter harenae]
MIEMEDDKLTSRGAEAGPLHSVGRAITVLRLIGSAPEPGLRSRDISEALDLHKTTTSRMLSTLCSLGAISRDRSMCYRVSDDFRASLGVPPSTRYLQQIVRPVLGVLTEKLEDVSFMSVPNGLDSLCVERNIGTYPVQALSLNVGGRRPLGVGAGSMALLAWSSDEERPRLIELQRDRLSLYRPTVEEIATEVERSRELGFTDLPGFVAKGMSGMGIAIRNPAGEVLASLSVAAISDRLSGERRDLAIKALRSARDEVEKRLRLPAAQVADAIA